MDYWYLLPVGCLIAALAMSSGISAGNFWVPVYLLWARFEPPLAFWMTLATMLCGYGSGVGRNLRQGTIDRRIIRFYLPLTVPAALVGGYLSPILDVSWLLLLFGLFVLAYGGRMLVQMTSSSRQARSHPSFDEPAGRLDHVSDDSVQYAPGVGLVGGLLLGLIAVGLGELLLPSLLARRRSQPPAMVVGSTVLVIFVTSLAAALVRLHGSFLTALSEQHTIMFGAMMFAAPGVLVGGQVGPWVARHLDERTLGWYMAIILVLVGILMLVRFLAMVAFAR